jgi:general secretion pathway protein I
VIVGGRALNAGHRRGLTLMEVVVAMAILLMALSAIAPLIQIGMLQAGEAQTRSTALKKCQSKIAEVMAGIEPLSGQTDSPFADEADDSWKWSMDVSQPTEVANVWAVQVTVYRQMPSYKISVTLSHMVMDPSIRASAVNTGLPPLQGTPPTTGN